MKNRYDAYRFLLQSERKMRYYTHDIKAERRIIKDGKVTNIPAREVSYNRLSDFGIEFASDDTTEEVVIQIVLRERLRDVLNLLDPGEQRLINELFYSNDGDGKTIRDSVEFFSRESV